MQHLAIRKFKSKAKDIQIFHKLKFHSEIQKKPLSIEDYQKELNDTITERQCFTNFSTIVYRNRSVSASAFFI